MRIPASARVRLTVLSILLVGIEALPLPARAIMVSTPDIGSNFPRTKSMTGAAPCPPDPVALPKEKGFFERILEIFGRHEAPKPSPSPVPWSLTCRDLAVGEQSDLAEEASTAPTTVAMRYRLKRVSEKKYRVTLNLKFVDARGSTGSGASDIPQAHEDESVNAAYLQRVNQCLVVANRAFKGPDGQSFEIALHSPASGETPPALSTIQVVEPAARSHSSAYAENVECTTITHELMHLLGLCDEYKEKSIGYRIDPQSGEVRRVDTDAEFVGYDCRKIGPDDSIMSSETSAFMRVFGPLVVTERYRYFEHPDELKPRPGTSLLRPEHFNAIVRPGCAENSNFYACSRNAYRTSTEHKGEGCAEAPESCTNRPR